MILDFCSAWYVPTTKLTTADVAAILGVGDERVRQLVSEGKLVAETVGVRAPIYVFERAAVEALRGSRDAATLVRETSSRRGLFESYASLEARVAARTADTVPEPTPTTPPAAHARRNRE